MQKLWLSNSRKIMLGNDYKQSMRCEVTLKESFNWDLNNEEAYLCTTYGSSIRKVGSDELQLIIFPE